MDPLLTVTVVASVLLLLAGLTFLPKNCKQSKKQRKVAHIPHWHQLTACMSRQGRE